MILTGLMSQGSKTVLICCRQTQSYRRSSFNIWAGLVDFRAYVQMHLGVRDEHIGLLSHLQLSGQPAFSETGTTALNESNHNLSIFITNKPFSFKYMCPPAIHSTFSENFFVSGELDIHSQALMLER